MKCPLCAGDQISQLDELDTPLLRRLYRQRLGIAVRQAPDRIRYCRCADCDLRFFDPLFCGDETFYGQLQGHAFYYLSEKQEYAIARRHVRPTDRILEIGAGRGAFARGLNCASYVGLEFSGSAIAAAQRDGIVILKETVQKHARAHPAQYDVVCAFQVLEHVGDVAGFLDGAIACLRPQGRLILSVPGEDGFMGREVNNVLNMPPHHVTHWTRACLSNLPRLFGVTLAEIQPDRLDERHVPSYATTVVIGGVRKVLRMKSGMLSPFFASPLVRAKVKVLSLLLTPRIKKRRLELIGHSVTATYVAGA
jgi:2-polyprenyl-3-methyl-5-hydroxy-6-metoxy-1,4-benzoquinol methylase